MWKISRDDLSLVRLLIGIITLTTFEGSELSRSESIPFAQSKNVARTRKLVLEIASKVHYLVLFFSSAPHKLFSSP